MKVLPKRAFSGVKLALFKVMETQKQVKKDLKQKDKKIVESRKDGKSDQNIPHAPDYENFLKNKDVDHDEERGKVRGN
ncbi:MAG: hypothetical protein H7333_12190 [Bdellovibrionales bacterium]|nr:hypothetical protein [Oligoflexia bacterium]